MKRVFITGSYGRLGCSLSPFLSDKGYYVLRHGRNVEADFPANLEVRGEIHSVLNESLPDVIINLAANTNVDDCEHRPHQAYLGNAKIVEHLVTWIQQTEHFCHLVQISTDQLYDGNKPSTEEEVILRNYYAFSKFAGELIAATVPSTVLRTNYFGRSQRSRGESFSDWIVRSLIHGKQIRVFEDVYFSPLSLNQLVNMVEITIANLRSGIFNLGSKRGMSKADFAFAIAKSINLPSHNLTRGSVASADFHAYRPRDMRMDSTLFEDTFGVILPTLGEEISSMKHDYEESSEYYHDRKQEDR